VLCVIHKTAGSAEGKAKDAIAEIGTIRRKSESTVEFVRAGKNASMNQRRLLVIADREPSLAVDGESYTMSHHIAGFGRSWRIDLLHVSPSAPARPYSVDDEEKTFERSIQIPPPPMPGRLYRTLGEISGERPFFLQPVPPKQELARRMSGCSYDAIYVASSRLSAWAGAVASLMSRRPKCVLALSDSLSETMRRDWELARLRSFPYRSRIWHAVRSVRALTMPRAEAKLIDGFDLVLVQTQTDRNAVIDDCGPGAADKMLVTPNGVKEALLSLPYDGADRKRLVHLGPVSRERRNLLFWFLRTVYPRLKRSHPEVQLDVVGSINARDRKRLESIGGVRVRGFVADLRDVFAQTTLSVSPVFMRCGLVTKVLDSMAAGVPASGIGTFNGFENFHNGVHGFEARSADEWSKMLIDLLDQPELLRQVSANAREMVRAEFRWPETAEKIHERLEALCSSGRGCVCSVFSGGRNSASTPRVSSGRRRVG